MDASVAKLLTVTYATEAGSRLALPLSDWTMTAWATLSFTAFLEEGVMRRALRLTDGRREDLVLMSMLREQWPAAPT